MRLFFFIDALGWELVRRHPHFLEGVMPHRRSLRTILGYSSACDPSIISGSLPCEHLMWSSFFYAPQNSPFRWTRWLRFLPKKLTRYQRVRNRLSRAIAWINGFTGYFQIYQVPFEFLPYFDYAEKDRIWGEKGVLRGTTIFQELAREGVPFHVDDSFRSDEEKCALVGRVIEEGNTPFVYCLLGKLDALMHARGTQDVSVSELLEWYDGQIRALVSQARERFGEVEAYVFSDHGMHDVTESFDLIGQIESLDLTYGEDYVAMYDSTMARFWFLKEGARFSVERLLTTLKVGEILSEERLRQEGCYFEDARYGELIFLLKPGVLMIPSFMGLKPIPGMHGYDPDDPPSAAAMLSTHPLPDWLLSIEQIYFIMGQSLKSSGKSCGSLSQSKEGLPTGCTMIRRGSGPE